MNAGKIRIGIIGTANIAIRSVIPAIIALPGQFELVGIASRTLEKADNTAARFGIKSFASYIQLLTKEIIDAVYIPLPNALHYKWVRYALERGIHVLVEKSLGCKYPEVESLVGIAERQNVALVENFQFRFHRQLQFITDIFNSGELGELRCLRSLFGFPPFADAENIRYKRELGGGALLDAGAYPVKIAQHFLGADLKVKAASLHYDPIREIDFWGGAFLQKRDSAWFAEIAFGFDNYYQCNIELWGSRGKIYTNRIFTAPPGYAPVIEIERNGRNIEHVELMPDDHFVNMLSYFHDTIFSQENRKAENIGNINQARLLAEIILKSNE